MSSLCNDDDWRFDGTMIKVQVKFENRDDDVKVNVMAPDKIMERNKLLVQKYPQQLIVATRNRQKPKHCIEIGLIRYGANEEEEHQQRQR